MFDRFIKLIGEEQFNIIQEKNILLVGLGGVGSYAFEALVRNGFKNITIIDYDTVDITNLNRQLYTDMDNIGKSKVMEEKKRAEKINSNINVTAINEKLDVNNIENILNNNYDYIIDACDDIDIKFELINNAQKYPYKLISSMGTAKKLDPTKLVITTLDKTFNDPLAKILRKKIKDANIKIKINVVSSTEIPIQINELGSNNLVPSTAGLFCVSYIINDILNTK